MRMVNGRPPVDAQLGIKETLRAQGYFLACQCRPAVNTEVASPDDTDLFERATVTGKQKLAANIYRVHLKTPNSLQYYAGQFVNLRRGDNLIRSYSLASAPRVDQFLELHVKRMKNGRMSSWICDELKEGDALDLHGPNGECFYIEGRPEQAMLLIGTGTGLAPLIGIVRDALSKQHTGEIHLFHGSQSEEGLYLTEMLYGLDQDVSNFFYHPCLSRQKKEGFAFGRADDQAFEMFPKLMYYRVFICGAPPMVHGAKKRAYLAGAGLEDINADPFEVADLRMRSRNL